MYSPRGITPLVSSWVRAAFPFASNTTIFEKPGPWGSHQRSRRWRSDGMGRSSIIQKNGRRPPVTDNVIPLEPARSKIGPSDDTFILRLGSEGPVAIGLGGKNRKVTGKGLFRMGTHPSGGDGSASALSSGNRFVKLNRSGAAVLRP